MAYTPYCNIPYRAHNSGTWCLNCRLTFREGISEMRNSNATGFQLLLAYFKTNLTKHVGKHFVPSLSRYHYHLAVWLTVLNNLPAQEHSPCLVGSQTGGYKLRMHSIPEATATLLCFCIAYQMHYKKMNNPPLSLMLICFVKSGPLASY